ncbi:MAG: hypothetical protein KGH50_01440 [Candidatus Micrarchaeota archaeon]|nr:hypothetical protein [Candidatus Micrarchaeota archaeon]
MSLDSIKKDILSEAESKARDEESAGSEEAGRIVSEAKKRAGEILKNARAEAEKEAERLRQESEAGLEIETDTVLNEARGAVIEKAVKELKAQVDRELMRNQIDKLLERAVKEFSETVGNEDFTIRTRKGNASLLKSIEGRREYADIDGFVLVSNDGKMAMRIVPGEITGKYMDILRKNVSSRLFKERAPSGRAPVKRRAVKAKKPRKVRKR